MDDRGSGLRRRFRLISQEVEKPIIIGLITSPKILSALQPFLNEKLFVYDTSNIIASWCADYFQRYSTAPGKAIEAVFLAERANLKPEQATSVSAFLQFLSDSYIQNPPNEEYLIDQGREYLFRQQIVKKAKEAQGIIESGGNARQAELILSNLSPSSNGRLAFFEKPTSDPAFISRVFETLTDPILTLPSNMNPIIGPLYRGWLFGIMGPMKRGKTWILIDLAIRALRQRQRVTFISLEMTSEQLASRIYQYLGVCAPPWEEEELSYIFPALDCRFNQENLCELGIRTCRVPMPEEFTEGQEYVPCAACRLTRRTISNFSPKIYLVKEVRPALTRAIALEAARDFEFQFGTDLIRVIGYPAYSANLQDIMTDLNLLEKDGFFSDLILLDYPDILAPEDHRRDDINRIDDTWKTLKSLAQIKQCLVIAPTQGSRGSFKKELMDPTDTPWDIRKLAHCDLMIGLNQTTQDKAEMIMKFNIIVHRWKEFTPNRVAVALQQIKLGQPNLDGYVTTIKAIS